MTTYRAAVMLMLTALPLSAYYGARFEPPDGFVYHGCGWDGDSSQARYSEMFPFDHQPLVLQVVADMPGYRGFTVERVRSSLTRPIVHPDSQYIEYGLHFRDRTGAMLDSLYALTNTLDHYVETLAIALRAVNRPFFLRIGFEFNGWWNPYHPYIFPLAFRKLVSELRSRDVPEFASVWCYEPDAGPDFAESTALGWKWYPGDDVVDWFGLDPFDMEHFNPALPDSLRGELTPKGKTEAFLRFARDRGKPVYLNELSARNVFIVPDSLDPEGDSGRADFAYWFAPFFSFVRNHPEIKGWNYINLDWTKYEPYKTWGDARLQINSEIRTRWVDTLMQGRFLNAGYDMTLGLEEHSTTTWCRPRAVVTSRVLNRWPNADSLLGWKEPNAKQWRLFDASGCEVLCLHPDGSDQPTLSHGVYFVHADRGREAPEPLAVRKIIVTK